MLTGTSEPSSVRGRPWSRKVQAPVRMTIDVSKKGLAIIEYNTNTKKIAL